MEFVFPDAAAMARAFTQRFEADAAESIAARGRYAVALTGGSAATTLYPSLAQAKVDWPKVHVFFGDERLVPASHPDSNYGLALQVLLGQVKAQVHPIRGDVSGEQAAELADADLNATLGIPAVLDAIHLGMGPDGHVCSLFPGHHLLQERARQTAWLDDSPKPPPGRVTFTMPLLWRARALWFLVQGAGKADAVKAALKDPQSALPAALATRGAPQSYWLLDAAAASKL